MENPEVILNELLANDASARLLARHLVTGHADAEDVAQDAWLAALSNPPRRREAVSAWLSSVVRRLAKSRRDSEARRRRTEGATTDLDFIEARRVEAARHQVATAVFELEEPYRTAVYLRYFEDLPPRKIANRLDVTVAAVEGRLRRGLQKLRARLDRDFGDRKAWSAALLPLTGLAAGEATAATAATTGALIMGTKIKVGLGVAAILIAGGAVALLSRGEDEPPPKTVAEAPTPSRSKKSERLSAATKDERAAEVSGESSDTANRNPMKPPATAIVHPPEATTLQGRCVDAITGQPLAGCSVSLEGMPRDSVEVENHVVRHGAIRWDPPDVLVTGAEGRFAFAISPPPPFKFTLRVTRTGKVPMIAMWRSLQRGMVEDLGDVSMRAGVPIGLRVVDSNRTPQAGVDVHLWRWPPSKGDGALPNRYVHIRTDPDGAGRCPHPILPGTWKVSLANRKLEEPEEIQVGEHATDTPHELVVRTAHTITGVVLDQEAEPVVGAVVMRCPYDSRVGHRARAEADGTFRLELPSGASREPIALSVVMDGFDLLWKHGSYPWGSADVRLVIRRGLPIDVRVRDARTGAPVEAFGVRCFLESRPTAHLPDKPERLRHLGRHAGGNLTIPAAQRGVNLLMVEPLDKGYAPSPWVRASVGESAARVCEIQLWPNVERCLQVVDEQGRPVAGTVVELLRPAVDEPVRLDSAAGTPSLLSYNNHDKLCVLLQQGKTDERGELLLSGPGNERLAVRIIGPGHPPQVINGVVLDPTLGPLRVVTNSACELVGLLRPREALSRMGPGPTPWKHAARRGDASADRASGGAPRPIVQLVPDATTSGSDGKHRPLSTPVGEDGRFSFSGVPAGAWKVYLNYSMPLDDRGGSVFRRKMLGTIRGLRKGEKRELVYDISSIFPGRLTGTVFLNGRRLKKERISFPAVTKDREGRPRLITTNRSTSTDARGAFSIDLKPGIFRLRVAIRRGGRRGPSVISGDIEIPSGGRSVRRDFQLACTKLEVRILGSDGKTPVRGVSLYSMIPAQRWRFYTPKSDRDGRIVLDRVPPGAIKFTVWPKHLRTNEAKSKFKKDHARSWREDHPCLGIVEIPVGVSRVAKELVMPAGSGY